MSSVVLGVVLAAATGLRVFLPMLIASGAAYFGFLPLDDNFTWLATPTALMMLGVAAIVEIAAFYLPGIDNLLDLFAAPIAVVAGVVMAAAVMIDIPPALKWTAAIIAGGGAAGLTHGLAAVMRAKSTVFTAGVGNPAVATAELGGASALPLLALAVPLAAFVILLLLLGLATGLLRRLRGTARRTPPPGGHGS